MAIDPDMAPDPEDPSIRPNQNRGSKNAMEGLAIHGFFAPDAVGLQNLMRFIRNQRCGERMLVAKRFLRLRWVGRNAEDGGSAFGERTRKSCEVDRLFGAARSVGAWVKKQHELFARIISKRNGAAAIAGQAERGRLCSLGQGGFGGGRRIGLF